MYSTQLTRIVFRALICNNSLCVLFGKVCRAAFHQSAALERAESTKAIIDLEK